jgi:cytochrome c oxidase cbb3-type subunit 1
MWVAGIEEGLMWRAYDAQGFLQYSFIESVMAVHPFYIIRMLGGVMFLLGAMLMAYNLFMTVNSATTAPGFEKQPAPGLLPGASLAAAE